jgi:hypothetical protein
MMKRRTVFLLLIFGSALAIATTPAAAQLPSPQLEKLGVSVGRWVFHGTELKTKSGKPASFTWNEDCRWSPNHLFLECTFSNVWAGKPVESLVVDTFNTRDRSYWHYELYATGEHGGNPFVSRMDINGNTWIEYGQQAVPGKKSGERIVYNWDPPNRVRVAIETSQDGVDWTPVDAAEGAKQQ